jgi:hypothetical protein
MKKCEYKVPGGKLICAKVETQDNKITFLQFTGDFFLLPETDLEYLERNLLENSTNPNEINRKIVKFFKKRRTVIAGAKPEDFAHVLNMAIKESK